MGNIVYNPYDYYAPQLKQGFDFIITALPREPYMDDLVRATLDYIATLIPNGLSGCCEPISVHGSGSGSGSGSSSPKLSPAMQSLLLPTIPTAANDYQNLKIVRNMLLDSSQRMVISSALTGVRSNAVDSLEQFWLGIEDQINLLNTSNKNKMPLFIAATMAKSSVEYWKEIVEISLGGEWSAFLNPNVAINYSNIPIWTGATFIGALSGFSQLQRLSMGQNSNLNDFDVVIAQIGSLATALGLTTAKVVFKFPQGPRRGITLGNR